MKILVLGGTKFFGKRLVQKLLDEGHKVSVASTGKTALKFSKSVEHFAVDRTSESSLAKALGSRQWDLAYDQIGFNAHDAKIAGLVLHKKIEHLIYTSSQSVYGEGLMLNETDFSAEIYEEKSPNLNSYQEGKRLAEKEYVTQLSFSVTAVRLPIVLGMDDPTKRLLWHISRIKKGLPIYFPNINSRIGFISSSEAASFLFWLADNKVPGSINAGSPDSISLRELIELIEAVVGKKAVIGEAAASENHSPFGIKWDWTMSMSKAEKHGFHFSNHATWLPKLIETMSAGW